MEQILLDTNFILTCIKQKIDFFEEISLMGMQILIPEQVINEIKRVVKSQKKLHFRDDAELALKLLEKNEFEKIKLKDNFVDKGVKKYAKDYPDLIIATLDKKIQGNVPNKIMFIRGNKRLEIR